MNNAELTRWLQTATHDLPPAVRQITALELTAHYEDALDAALDDGLNSAEAHKRALSELGSAQEIARGLWETHMARGRFYRASAISLLPSLGIVLIALMSPMPMLIALNWVTLLCTLYTLDSLRALLAGRFAYYHVALPNRLIAVGLSLAVVIMTLLNVFIYEVGMLGAVVNDPIMIFKYEFLVEMPLLTVVYAVCAGAVAMIGVGWLMLSNRLAIVETRRVNVNGGALLLKPLRLIFLFSGFALIGQAIAIVFGNSGGLALAASVAGILGTFKFTFCCYIFFRAAGGERRTTTPAQYA